MQVSVQPQAALSCSQFLLLVLLSTCTSCKSAQEKRGLRTARSRRGFADTVAKVEAAMVQKEAAMGQYEMAIQQHVGKVNLVSAKLAESEVEKAALQQQLGTLTGSKTSVHALT